MKVGIILEDETRIKHTLKEDHKKLDRTPDKEYVSD